MAMREQAYSLERPPKVLKLGSAVLMPKRVDIGPGEFVRVGLLTGHMRRHTSE